MLTEEKRKEIKDYIVIGTPIASFLLFLVRQLFIIENSEYYNIPNKYFTDLDMSDFFIFAILLVALVYINDTYLNSNSYVKDGYVYIIFMFCITFLLFLGCVRFLKHKFTSYVLTTLFILFITIYINTGKKLSISLKIKKIKIEYRYLLYALCIIYIIKLLSNCSVLDIVFMALISIVFAILLNGLREKACVSHNELYKRKYDNSTLCLIIATIILLVVNLKTFPQFKNDYELINVSSNKCKVIVTHYNDGAVVVDGEIDDNNLTLDVGFYEVIKINDKKIIYKSFDKVNNWF